MEIGWFQSFFGNQALVARAGMPGGRDSKNQSHHITQAVRIIAHELSTAISQHVTRRLQCEPHIPKPPAGMHDSVLDKCEGKRSIVVTKPRES